MKQQIEIKKVYSYPIQAVWSALTEKEAISDWLMETKDFELSLGHSFHLKTKPQGNFDGILKCKVLSFEAPNALSYSWQSNGMQNPTTVNWLLKPLNENETMLHLSHNGFEGVSGWLTRQMLNFGWKSLLSKKLLNYLQDEKRSMASAS